MAVGFAEMELLVTGFLMTKTGCWFGRTLVQSVSLLMVFTPRRLRRR